MEYVAKNRTELVKKEKKSHNLYRLKIVPNLQMLFDYLYKENSAGDLGTLYQLKARLNRKDVHAKVNKSYHGTEAFFHTVVDGYVVYAAMEFFGMTSADAKLTLHVAQANDSHTLKEKRGELVNKYVLFKPELDESATLHEEIREAEAYQERYVCRFPSCNKIYVNKKPRNNHEVSAHGLTMPRENEERSPPNPKDDDGVSNYSHNIMKTGLLLRDFQDVIKEWQTRTLVEVYDASLQSCWKDQVCLGGHSASHPVKCSFITKGSTFFEMESHNKFEGGEGAQCSN